MYIAARPVASTPRLHHLLLPLLALALMAPAATAEKLAPADAAAKAAAARAEAAFQFAHAKLLADTGDFEGALAAYQKSVALDPGDPYSLVELARFQSYLAQISRSAQQQRQLLDESAKNAGLAKAAAPDNVDVLETYGQVHMRLGELDPSSASLALAQGAFEILRKKQPQELPVLLSLGQLYLWQQDADKAVEVLETAARTSPGHRMVLSMLVEAQLAASEGGTGATTDGAIETLQQLLKVEPTNPEHRIRLAELLAARDDHEGAVAVLAAAPADMAPSQRLRQLLARELHFSGRQREALALVDELAGRSPAHEGMRRLRAAILSALTRYREAIAELEPLVRKELDPERRSQDTLLLARLKERIGEGSAAAELLSGGLGDFHGDAQLEATIALAGVLERAGRAEEAAERLRAALSRSDGQELVQLGGALAEILHRSGRTDEALALYDELRSKIGNSEAAAPLAWRQVLLAAGSERWRQVLELLPGLPPAGDRPELAIALVQLRAAALAGLGQVDQALASLEDQPELPPLQAKIKRWEILEEAGRGAELESELAAMVAGDKPEDLRFAAQMLQRFERWGEVVPLLEKLLSGEPDSPELSFGLAVAYERSGRREPAVAIFQKLLERDPHHAASLNYLGYMWAEKGENLDKALELLLRAVSLEPDNGAYVDSLGWVYFMLGRYEEAREQLEWAVRLIGDDATLHEHLGAVYAKLGRPAEAREALLKSLALEKKKERQAEIQQRLDALTPRGPGRG